MGKKMTCIACPVGCELLVERLEGKYIVNGNACKRGEKYGIDEMVNPMRNIASTVLVKGGLLKLLPVKTDAPVPKDMIFKVMDNINNIYVRAPIKRGDIIIKNVCGTNVNIRASRDM